MKALEYEVDNERLLIEAAQQDPTRFAELYESNFERVYAYLLRRVGSREEAEDLTADVFHQALVSIGRFEWRGRPFVAWLLGIAGNVLRDRWQRVTKLPELPLEPVVNFAPEPLPTQAELRLQSHTDAVLRIET